MQVIMRASLLVALAVLHAASAPAGATIVLRRGNVAEPNTLDTQKYSLTYEAEIIRDLNVGLLTIDAFGKPIPGAAESWTVSPDGLVYTFKLRPNIAWSDGVPLTATDAVTGLRRAFDPATQSWFANQAYMIKNAEPINKGKLKPETLGVRAIDPQTLEIRMEHPSPILTLHLAVTPMLYPVPAHLLKARPNDWTKPGIHVSSGAYGLASWRKDDHIKLTKNPRFYDAGNVQIDAVIYYPTVDDSAALNRFRAGELDLNNRFPPNQLEFLRKTIPDQIRISPALWVTYLVPNFKRKPFDDPRVRRALSLSIERKALTDNILRNGEKPFWGVVPNLIDGYQSAVTPDTTALGDRQATARKLLGEAGYTDAKPLTLTLNHRAGLNNKLAAVAVANMWAKIGIKAQLMQLDVAVHYNALREGDFEIADAGWTGNADPEFFMYLVLTDSTEVNWGAYSNAEVDALSLKARAAIDLTERLKLFARAEAKAVAENAIIPLFLSVERSIVKPYVKGYEDNPLGYHPTRFIRLDKRP